ncbi:MAG: hypothetical protein O2948_04420 [Proteobacteria bacterium]|nr:hypothetical protein [Pseudomonadota bacterium]MDA0928148.1 hypothetical protein [Pseudomonadota bacterium]
MSAWQQQLQQLVTPQWRSRLFGDARGELVKACSDTLLVLGSTLIHAQSGSRTQLETGTALKAEDLAIKAAALLARNPSESKDRSILLLLPPSEFVATSSTMPGLIGDNLVSALRLQKETLLPACNEKLALAVESNPAIQQEPVSAIWVSQARLDSLFNAFAEQNLLLAVVRPRLLQLLSNEPVTTVIEKDGDILTAVSIMDGYLESWLQINEQDLQQDEFSEQWQAELANMSNSSPAEVNVADADDYLSKLNSEAKKSYCFFPAGALAARKKAEKGRQALLAAAAVAGLLMLASIPFIAQSFELAMASSRLESTREMSAEARADQAVVVDFENQWGIFNDFPDQHVREALYQLQEVLAAERLSSLELSDGLIRIQGTSSDPQAILQRLEQDPMFTEVVFSRATNNTRYYIDLRLASVNFEGYLVRYFPDQT